MLTTQQPARLSNSPTIQQSCVRSPTQSQGCEAWSLRLAIRSTQPNTTKTRCLHASFVFFLEAHFLNPPFGHLQVNATTGVVIQEAEPSYAQCTHTSFFTECVTCVEDKCQVMLTALFLAPLFRPQLNNFAGYVPGALLLICAVYAAMATFSNGQQPQAWRFDLCVLHTPGTHHMQQSRVTGLQDKSKKRLSAVLVS